MNTSFSQKTPNLQLAWDSVSTGALKTCPRYYQLTIIEGHTPSSVNVHLKFGLVYHGALERFDHGRAQGKSIDESTLWAVRWALGETWDQELNAPWNSEDSNKNRWTLIRSIVWYIEQFKDDPMETLILNNGKPAVELSFRFELGLTTSEKENFILCGHLDKVASLNNHLYISDKKSTKHQLDEKYFSQFTPDNQMSGYSFAGRVALSLPIKGIVIDAAQVMVGFTRYQRAVVGRTDEQLNEWYKDLKIWLRQAEYYADNNYWPMNERSCFGCSFRGICSKTPSVREQWLKNAFSKRVWDPLQRRGDV